MKKIVFLVAMSFMTLNSCKTTDKKKETLDTPKKKIIKEVVREKEAIKLPPNVIQLNKEEFKGDGITLTKLQFQNLLDGNYICKFFFKADNLKRFQDGNFSFFIQNFVYPEDIDLLDKNNQKSGVVTYWVNLKSAKKYKGEYVLFKSFKSKIDEFNKTVVGVMNLKDKTDVFRVSYDDSVIN